ncbi:hypothetical protein [Paraflavitalea speifideaquila]|uniref:hypothetical protein n=1 Tax=Paraflavitalea speifideaquila TaxID=3076558 RepID=UPI0028EDFF7F|nr:hypothetical protein [Paraflavitalea speifideiaquila]
MEWMDNDRCGLSAKSEQFAATKIVLALECYHGVATDEMAMQLQEQLPGAHLVFAGDAMLPEAAINEMVYPYVTDDPVFGYITPLSLINFFDENKVQALQQQIAQQGAGLTIVYGTGAALLAPKADLLVYADMPRWEIQLRFRRNEVGNLGISNTGEPFAYKYKRAFFVDWRVCDRHKTSSWPIGIM